MARDDDSELERIEHAALDRLDDEAGHVEADIDAADHEPDEDDDAAHASPLRVSIALAFPVLAAAVMVGGVFEGVAPRIIAALSGLLGMALALGTRRIGKPMVANAVIAVGMFAIGLITIALHSPGSIPDVRTLAQEAATSGDVLRPPVAFEPGWYAIVGWLMGIVGFATVWVGTVVRKQSLALLVALPFAAIAGISVPDSAQVASGIVVLVLFALGLGLLSSVNSFEGSQRPPLSYELRKTAKGLPVIALITVALIGLAQTDFLFPAPQIDPAEEPQKPKAVPLDEVEDRVLFEVSNPDGGELTISGPWRLGTLDVYDGNDWRLPAFTESELEDVPENGIVNEALYDKRGTKARFKVQGLGGTVLPGVPNTVGIIASGPQLAYDSRSGNIRVASGQVKVGLAYEVAGASLPKVEDLRRVSGNVPVDIERFTEIGSPPPAVQTLIDEAATKFDNAWDRFDFLRNHVLDNVTATGTGTPVSISADRVQEILGDTLEASPYEIVAMQAMLGRWAGLPARIGYGFDGGDLVNGKLEIRPKHGAAFPEVYFPGYEWLPVIGTPKKAKPTVGNDPSQQQVNPNILPSDDIAVKVFLPALVPPPSNFAEQLRNILLFGGGAALLVGAVYVATPAVRKAILRSRRRTAARAEGPRARVALAYAEWRDHALDFGYRYPTDTPLMFLDRFVDDPEHIELAWLTTRSLWGDMREHCDDRAAASAEELSRALRRRLSQAQPSTLRFVAAVSRLSLREPFAPDTDLSHRTDRRARRARRRDDTPPSAVLPVSTPSTIEEPERVPSPL